MIKILHHIWLGGRIPSEYKTLREEVMLLNPDFEFRLWTESELGAEGLMDAVRDIRGYSKQSNLLRMLVLQRFGGVYMDLDFKHVQPLPEFEGCVVSDSRDFGIQGSFIYAEPNTPVLQQWIDNPLLTSQSAPIEKGMEHLEGVTVLDHDAFFSHPYCRKGKAVEAIPESAIAIHLWNGYWKNEHNAHKTIPFHQIQVIVISLESNEERRRALDLPFDYQIRIQKPITGVIPSSSVTLGRVGCTEAHKDAIRHAKARNFPAVLVLEDDAVWEGKDPHEIKCEAPITFLGADPIAQTRMEGDLAYCVIRTTAVIYRQDSYDSVLALEPTIERLRRSRIPVGGKPWDLALSENGVSLSSKKFFTQSDAPSSIGHGKFNTTGKSLYSSNVVFDQPFDGCDHEHNCGCTSLKSYIPYYQKLLEIIRPTKVFEWGPSANGNSRMAVDAGAKVFAVEQDRKWMPELPNFEGYQTQVEDGSYTGLHGHDDCDIYFVDSRRRAECLKSVSKDAKPSTIACLHDAGRGRYREGLMAFKYVLFPDAGFAVATNDSETFNLIQHVYEKEPIHSLT